MPNPPGARLSPLAVIRDAYGFTFTHLGAIIGLIWLPMVIMTVTGFFALQRYCDALIDTLSGGNPATLGAGLLTLLAYTLASILLYAVMYVAVAQLALGQHPAGPFLHFSLGPPEWRMFRALLRLLGLGLVFAALAGIGVVLVTALLPLLHAAPVPLLGEALVRLALLVVLAVVVPRFVLPLFAIAVTEQGPVLRRAWELTVGNFWPLLAVAVAVLGPIMALILAAEALLPAAPIAPAATEQAQAVALLAHERDLMPMLSGIGFVFSPFAVGLIVGASVSIWRGLAAKPTDFYA